MRGMDTYKHDIEATIQAIEGFARDTGQAVSTVCRKAGKGGDFVSRIRAGKRVHPETLADARRWIDEQRSQMGTPQEAAE